MIAISRPVCAPADQVFEVLADGWSYAGWVLGTSHIRQVDPGWPAEGSRIHHTVGPWPFVLNDETKVLAVEPARFLELEARLWPLGVATVRITLTSLEGDRTEVRMEEVVTHGPGRRLPERAQELLLRPRNNETLSRLADLAEGRHGSGRRP